MNAPLTSIPGLITVSSLSYLVTITRRQQVAQVFGYPVYVVTDVAVTPCSSKTDAVKSIKKTAVQLRTKGPHSLSEEGESSDEEVELPSGVGTVDEVDEEAIEDGDARPDSARSSVAEDVIRRRGSYGRFAQRWFSKSGWTLDQKRTMGMSNSPTLAPKVSTASTSPVAKVPLEEEKRQTQVSTLLPKLLRTVQVLFGSSRSFYFSYDIDITSNLSKSAAVPNSNTPLHAQADSIFFWNRHVIQPFLAAGQDSLALPLMQGFVGQRSFVVDSAPPQQDETAAGSLEMCSLSPTESRPSSPPVEKTRESVELRPSERRYLITLISRRSTKRAGLRYLRRGIDQNGFTANMVETEQILAPSPWDSSSRIHSFLQIRGSIPLFFTQSPYSLKPVPILQHSNESNYQACRTHFERLVKSYGELQIVNLVEQHGIEEPIGTRYKRSIERYNEDAGDDGKIPFEWFDFHRACRGMKFENVSYLLLRLKDKLEDFGSTTQKDGITVQKQKGVLRTNCMDCLDRTNVCQSSFAKHVLEVQLKEEGIDMSAQLNQETVWFNTLWADNGDAVSKQYASTAAMKGDYTRTKKRDYRGALNDIGLSLARFYSGYVYQDRLWSELTLSRMVNDYFSQTAIDFLLGNVSVKVFDEFEADMMTKDPAVSMTKMREQAVELCQKRVVADEGEEFHGGWVLVSPSAADTVKSWPMEEVVLLLTDVALYLCRFDWNMDKVSSFERVQLANVTHIKFGTYITSTNSLSQVDELRNVGFVVSHQPGKSDIKRTNTRTFSSRGEIAPSHALEDEKDASQPSSLASLLSGRAKSPPVRRLAFKAPYTDSSMASAGTGPEQTEIQQVVTICAEIERLAFELQLHKDGDNRPSIIEKGDIISLEAAKKSTGLFEQLGHSIKKLVWA